MSLFFRTFAAKLGFYAKTDIDIRLFGSNSDERHGMGRRQADLDRRCQR